MDDDDKIKSLIESLINPPGATEEEMDIVSYISFMTALGIMSDVFNIPLTVEAMYRIFTKAAKVASGEETTLSTVAEIKSGFGVEAQEPVRRSLGVLERKAACVYCIKFKDEILSLAETIEKKQNDRK